MTAQVDDLARNPYPALARLRSQGAVLEGEIQDLIGTGLPMTTGLNAFTGPHFSVFGYDAVHDVLRDGATYSSGAYSQSIGQVLGRTILEMDEPEHRRYRRLISAAFTSEAMTRWREVAAVPILTEMLNAIRPAGRANLVEALTFPFPVRVIARILGLPDEDQEQFHEWATAIVDVAALEDPDVAVVRDRATASLTEYLERIVDERRHNPQDDVISLLVTSQIEGAHLGDEDIVSFLRLLLPAGAETTFRSSGNMLLALLSKPNHIARLAAEPPFSDAVIDETLRWEPPIMAIGRVTTREVELMSCTLPAGTAVHVSLAAANHDANVYDAPEQCDFSRGARPHLAFSAGPHTCIGMQLARMEMHAVLALAFVALPGLQLEPDRSEEAFVTGLGFREPNALPVRWDT